jgi:hypothetical protein
MKTECPVERAWRLSETTEVFARRDSILPEAIDRVFGALSVVEHAHRVQRILNLDMRPAGQGAIRIFANGLPIARVGSNDELSPMLEAMIAGFAVRTRDDAAAFHAASVEIGGRAVLLPGGKGSGKSTLAVALALTKQSRGCYFGDEVAFVRFLDHALEAFPKSATLKQGVFGLFPESRTFFDPIRGPVRYLEPARTAKGGDVAPIGLVVFPRWLRDGPEVQVERIEPGEAAFDLVRACFGGLERDPRTLRAVASLSMLPAYRLDFWNTAAAVDMIGDLAIRARAA